jgi:Fic family protein
MNAVCDQANGMSEHPAVLSAWIHVAVTAIHPFRDGNGRTARVLASLAMYRGGFQLREFTSLEEWWGRHVDDYYRAFACLGTTFDASTDVSAFVETHVDAQLAQVRALDLRERVERRIWTAIENVLMDRMLDPRLAHAVWEALWERDVTSSYYVGMTDVSTATASKDLAAGVASGLLSAVGQRRGRRYLAGASLVSVLGAELGLDTLPDNVGAARARIAHVLAEAESSA